MPPLLHAISFIKLVKVKEKNFTIIIGGLDEPGVTDIIAKVCGAEESAALSDKGAKKMYLKENIWKPGQKVLVFAGADTEAASTIRTESRDKWMKHLKEWFDIGDIPGGLRVY